jgi:hypothetical protein
VHGRRRQPAFLEQGPAGFGVESALFGQLDRNVMMLKVDYHFALPAFIIF